MEKKEFVREVEQQTRIIKWFSALELQVMQRTACKISDFLREFKGFKKYEGEATCRIKPCRRQKYVRGVCARHYQFFLSLTKEQGVTWFELARLGLVRLNSTELWEKNREELCNATCDPNDPLHVLIKRTRSHKGQ